MKITLPQISPKPIETTIFPTTPRDTLSYLNPSRPSSSLLCGRTRHNPQIIGFTSSSNKSNTSQPQISPPT